MAPRASVERKLQTMIEEFVTQHDGRVREVLRGWGNDTRDIQSDRVV